MNPLAEELNRLIREGAPHLFEMLSELGRELYFPRGILSQTGEAKERATLYNATIGIARQEGEAMHLTSVMKQFSGLLPDEVLPYAPAAGKLELRKRWLEEIFRKNPSLKGKRVSLPVVTAGVTHGLSLAADLFVDRGDTVLVPEKTWGNYHMIFGVRHKAELKKYPFFSEKGGFDTEGFERRLNEEAGGGKVILILNFPNNPTGYSVTSGEGRAIVKSLLRVAGRGCNLVVLCDDAYFGLFYDEESLKESLFAHLADLNERIVAVKLDGATKEDFVWGFRIGFITFGTRTARTSVYEALEKKTSGAIRGNISNCPHPSQSIILRAMAEGSYLEQKQEKFKVLQARARKVREVLADERFSEVWRPHPFNSGYFMCLTLKGINGEDFRLRLLDDYGIGVIAVGDSEIRVAFSSVEEKDIPELFSLMYECARKMRAEALSSGRCSDKEIK